MAVDYRPLVFGGGIERSAGPRTAPATLMRTAENVILGEGKVEPRGGLALRENLGGDYVALVHASRVRLEGIEVTVEESTGRVSLKRTGGNGLNLTVLGTWQPATLSVGRVRAIGAESGGRVFVAHEERILSRRAHTVYYNPNVDDSTFFILQAEWARGNLPSNPADPEYDASDAYLRFRGVCPWLDYLVGWGFGTNDADAPEYVRISDPGEPTVFQDYAWVRAGQPGDPVMSCAEVPGGLLVYKETQTFLIRGSDRSNFGIDLTDEHFGLAGPRLLIVVGDVAYAWSLSGPRRNRGGLSEDISWPLGLPWPSVEDVATSGRLESGFAAYEPVKRQVLFVFEDWVYAFSVDDGKWAYWRLAEKVYSGGILYAVSGYVGPSRGYPAYIDGALANTSDTVYAHYQNTLPEGDEMVEVWVREVGGVWALYADQHVSTSPARFAITGREGGVQYEVAFRYLRAGLASEGYEVDDPSTWPVQSRGTETTAMLPPNDFRGSYVYANPVNTVTLNWTPPTAGATYRILRDGVEVAAALPAGTDTWQDIWNDGERPVAATHEYTLVTVYGTGEVNTSTVVGISDTAVPTLTVEEQNAPGANYLSGVVTAEPKVTADTTEVEIWTYEVRYDTGANVPWAAATVMYMGSAVTAIPVAALDDYAFDYFKRLFTGSDVDVEVYVFLRARYKYTTGGVVTYGPDTPEITRIMVT